MFHNEIKIMAKQKKEISKDRIIELYIEHLLEHGQEPPSVYAFAKENKFTEAEFYNFFGSFPGVEAAFYEHIFHHSYTLIQQSDDWEEADAREKLLTFYYTFFENLTANRSFVLVSIGKAPSMKSLKKLRSLRKAFKAMIHDLDIDTLDLKHGQLNSIQQKALEESAWIQLITTLKFWLEDSSPGFEKTDVFIEKAVNTSFELMNVRPIRRLLDFGKFILHERSFTS